MNRLKSKYTQYVVKPSGGGGGAIEGGYLVRFIVNGEPYCNISVLAGDAVQEPSMPEDVVFEGWYTAETGGQKIEFPFTPVGNVTIYAHVQEYAIVGFTGLTNINPGVTLTDDIADAGMWSTSTDGDYVTVSNPIDNHWPFNKIEEFTDVEGNAFVKFPKMWMKWITDSDGNIDGVKFANYKVDNDYFISDAFLDGKNETVDSYLDYFALGKYEISGSASKCFSKSGQTCLTALSLNQFRSACRAYGNASNYYNGYQVQDIQQYIVYIMLCTMYYHTKQISRTVYGGRTKLTGEYNSVSITGTTDGVVGLNGWNTSTGCIKVLGIENPFGNAQKFIDGILSLQNSTNVYIQRYPHKYTSNATDGVSIGFARPNMESGWIQRLRMGTNKNTKSAVYVSQALKFESGDSLNYDYFAAIVQGYFSSHSANSVMYAGGTYDSRVPSLFACAIWDTPDAGVNPKLSTRIAYRPVNE